MDSAWDILIDDPEMEYDHPPQPSSVEPSNFSHILTQPPPFYPPRAPSVPSSIGSSIPLAPKSQPTILPRSKVSAYEIRFHSNHVERAVSRDGAVYSNGDYVIVEADQGLDLGQIINSINVEGIPKDKVKHVIRTASAHEVSLLAAKVEKEKHALDLCQKKADENHLPMTITGAEFQYDGRKLTVYFAASTYIDFRQLVHSLFKIFGCRIWMVWCEGQSPVRDVFTHNGTSGSQPIVHRQ